MANRTLNTGNSLYTNLAFCLDGQSDAQDLVSLANTWTGGTPSSDGTAFTLTGQELTIDITPTGPVSAYVKAKVLSFPSSGAGPYIGRWREASDSITSLGLGNGYEDQVKAYARSAYNVCINYNPATDRYGTSAYHEMLIMCPTTSGQATLVNLDGTEKSTAASASNWGATQHLQRFMAGLASYGVKVELALLWTGRAVTWSDISSNIGTLFQAAASFEAAWARGSNSILQ